MCKHKCFPKTLLLFLSVALNILLLMVIFILLARPKELFSYNLTEIIGLFISVCIGVATVYLGYIANQQNKRLMNLQNNSGSVVLCVISFSSV